MAEMTSLNVKRLAAIDMYGTRGTIRRRRIILAEFLAGSVASVAFGIWLVTTGTQAGLVVGILILGMGLNYVALAVFALALSKPGALEAELEGVDTYRELRRYSALQFWVFVPLSLLVFTAAAAMRRAV
jgi:hypothetical protein